MKLTLIVILDNIRSHHNVGSIFRSADAFGIEKIVLGGITPHPPHRDIQKTALGATQSVAWAGSGELISEVKDLQKEGFLVYAVEQTSDSISLPDSIPSSEDKIAIVLGNEVKGVSPEVMEHCDGIWEIPQHGVKKSLNVSVCGGILMHHIMR